MSGRRQIEWEGWQGKNMRLHLCMRHEFKAYGVGHFTSSQFERLAECLGQPHHVHLMSALAASYGASRKRFAVSFPLQGGKAGAEGEVGKYAERREKKDFSHFCAETAFFSTTNCARLILNLRTPGGGPD